MDNLGSLLTTALGVISIATLAGLGLMRGMIVGLRESLADARSEIADKDRRAVDALSESARRQAATEAALTAANVRIQSQANDLTALGRVVTGEAHWVAISEQLDTHHQEAKTHWRNDEATMKKILLALERGQK